MSENATARGPGDDVPGLDRLLEDDPADLYENAPCGYFSTLPDGTIVKLNRTFAAWVGRRAEELLGRHLQELLSPGSRLFSETHLAPLLRMQGAVREIAVDLVRADGTLLPCLLNAVELRDSHGAPVLVRSTLLDATARRRYERELLAAQRAAEQSEARARTLQQVVVDLAATTTVRDVARVIVERSRSALGAAGAALVLVEAGRTGEGAPPRLASSAGLPADVLDRMADVAAGRDLSDLTREVRRVPLDAALRTARPALAEALSAAGIAEVILVPVATDQRPHGVLVLAVAAPGTGDLIALDEPATGLSEPEVELLRTLGRQAGQALERAQLHEETARQAARASFLLDAARLMAAAADVREVVARLADLAVARLGDVCMIDLATDQGILRQAARHGDPARQRLVDELLFRHLPEDEQRVPSVRAFRQMRTQWIPELRAADLAGIALDERHATVLRELEVRSLISVPLVADGRSLGVVTLWGDRRRRRFTASDVEVVEQLALQVALVVDKAQRYETDVRASHTLQASLLPPPAPAVEGLAVAVRYLPATRGVDVGGDFYDVVQMPGGPVALAVGDVVGHDITAAATMGQLRSVYRALLVDRPGPSAVIGRLQASWSLMGLQRMATAMYATLDPATGHLRIASAGHLPPLLVAADGAEFLPVQPSRMLGAPPASAPAVEWAGVLAPGETLLLFTDGLVESRDADLDAGLALLRETACRGADRTPEDLCDRLLAELAGAHRADDIALVALTRQG